jgi:hypothetical protein
MHYGEYQNRKNACCKQDTSKKMLLENESRNAQSERDATNSVGEWRRKRGATIR